MAKISIKHEAKPSALLPSRQCAECFILCMARAKLCFNCYKEFTHEHLFKVYPFQVRITHSASWVRRFWMMSFANVSVSRLIIAELSWIYHLVSLFTKCFSHLTMLYYNIELQLSFWCYMRSIALIFALILPCKVLYICIYIYNVITVFDYAANEILQQRPL